jgi:hypothetical protein
MPEVAEDYESQLRTGADEEKAVLDRQIAEEKAASVAAQERLAEARKAREPEWEAFKKKQAELEAIKPPTLANPPAPPETQEMLKPTSLQRTMGMASVFALLSVGLAKNSAIYGLKAMGGFLEGAHAGNVEQAEAALKDYNNNMKYVHDANEYSLQEYNAIFNNKKLSLEQQHWAFQQKALEFNDTLASEQLRDKGMTGVHALLRERAKIDLTFAKELKRSQEWQIRTELMRQKAAASAGTGGLDLASLPPPPGGGQKNEALLKTLDPNTAELVKRMANYDLPTSGFGGMDVKTRTKLTQLAALYDPAFSASNYAARAKTRMEYAPGGQIGANIQAINAMTHHIDDFDRAFSKLNNAQLQKWNSAKNKLQTEFGDPALLAVQVPAKAVADEIAKVLKGGRAAPTQEEMEAWQHIYSGSMSKPQEKAVVWQSLQVAGGRLAALQDAYEANMGGQKFTTIYPDTREIMIKHKPKSVPTPKWLSRGAEDLSDLEKKAELTQPEKDKLSADVRARVGSAMKSKDKDGKPIHFDPSAGRWVYD